MTSFLRKLCTVRWQKFDEGNGDTDMGMEIDDPTLEWEVQNEREEKHLLSYTNIWAIAYKIYNPVEAHEPNAVST